jgi:hypothetical protein
LLFTRQNGRLNQVHDREKCRDPPAIYYESQFHKGKSMGRKALCVGINDFKNYPSAALQGCVNDARERV